MDNPTHSLVGALLGQMGLKRRTGLAMPTLIIAANIPDIDASCTVLGMVSLAMRRGVTHGPIAMLVLPLILTGAMIAFDRRQTRRGTRPEDRPPLRPGWLLALAYIGCLSHPLFDWMNSYGIRLLEPFSHRWFYGDALFIVDPWLLAMLGAGVWLSRRREKAFRADWRRPAHTAFAVAAAYIALNLVISQIAVERTLYAYRHDWHSEPTAIVANPVPIAFWKREVLWRGIAYNFPQFGSLPFSLFSGVGVGERYGVGGDTVHWTARNSYPDYFVDPVFAARIARRASSNPEAKAFLFWSRMPVAEVQGDKIILRDQRFLGMTAGRFAVELKP